MGLLVLLGPWNMALQTTASACAAASGASAVASVATADARGGATAITSVASTSARGGTGPAQGRAGVATISAIPADCNTIGIVDCVALLRRLLIAKGISPASAQSSASCTCSTCCAG